jgi:hypothetical protein
MVLQRNGWWVARWRPLAAWLAAAATLGAAGCPDMAASLTLSDASPLHGTATLFHPYPFASVDNAVATVVNPAGLSARYSAEFFGAVTDAEVLRDGDSAFLLKVRGAGFAYERYRPIPDGESAARFTVAMSRPITRSVFIGSSYAWYFSDDQELDDLSSLDIGLLVRGMSSLSFAAAATGVNRPEYAGSRIDRLYTAGLVYGPIVGHFTVFAEDALYEGQSLSETVPAYGLEVEPLAGLMLRSRFDTDGDFRVGIEYNLPKSAYGVVGRYGSGGESDGRAGYLRLTDETYRSMSERSAPPYRSPRSRRSR